MTRLEIAARILAARVANDSDATDIRESLRLADLLIARELETRPKDTKHVHEFPVRWEWDGKPGRNIKRYCKCGQVEFGAIGEP